MEPQAQPQPTSKISPVVAVIVIVIVIVGGLIYWFLRRPPVPPPAGIEPPAGAAISQPDLGSKVYERATNPVADKLPETVAPVPNPLEGVYENPFE